MTDGGAEGWAAHAARLLGDEAVVAHWLGRLPPGYRERTTAAEFAEDVAAVAALVSAAATDGGGRLGGHHNLRIRPALPGDAASFRIRRAGLEAVELTVVLPVFESFGLVVTDAVPQHVAGVAPGDADIHFDDFGLRPARSGPGVDVAADGPRLLQAVEVAARGEADVDGLNELVVTAGLDWRQVVALRAGRRLRRQAGVAWSDAELDAALTAHPAVAAALVRLQEARLAGPAGPTDPGRVTQIRSARRGLGDALSGVGTLAEDQILRGAARVVEATLRSNWYALPAPRTLALKIDSAALDELPRPRPHVETFVHGPEVEGVHLRMGPVARGGIRWSDRPGDVRTEVLGLAAAQTKKNAIIVPTGAKGGFVVRGAGQPGAAEVLDAYRRYIAALLSISDNVTAAGVRHPDGVVAVDGDDPYLVVAADKGTAAFSDEANALSLAAGFWLGDAFASGGSHGYDHKAMGITARGAWVAVRRHFRQLGIDVQTEPVTVAGVGDMSGDVFGNGMLRSRALRLVAAFDHRHVFVDPDPDPERSFDARSALARRPGSSWADYDPAALSPGGGVWSRHAKEIDLTPTAAAAVGLEPGPHRPPEVVSAILTSSVDLLWFGGIGTFVKDAAEADAEVGDHANDAVRVTADRIRARVVAEGGNLGMTQRARIRYSRRGGRVNADFIDNAAGVATSDREVNLKILLGVALAEGRIDRAERDRLLAVATDEVAAEVLRQVDHSVAGLDRAVPDSAASLDAYIALLEHLADAGLVDRAVESLPDGDELAARRAAGAGLIRPELAGLIAFAKIDLVRTLVADPVVHDDAFVEAVTPYFPAGLRALGGDLVRRHRLYADLAANDVVGDMVDTVGPVWAYETAGQLGRSTAEVAAAYWAARQVCGLGPLATALEASTATLDPDDEAALSAGAVAAVTGLARHHLRRGQRVAPSALIAASPPAPTGGVDLWAHLDALTSAATAARWAGPAASAGLGAATAAEVAGALLALPAVAGIVALVAAPPPGRWAAWHAAAVADDLDDLLEQAVTASAPDLAGGAAVETVVSRWADTRAAALGRAARLVASSGARPSTPDALTVAGLALRALRSP